MEKHTVRNICRLGAVFIIMVLVVSAAHANSLLNPGFETTANGTNATSWTQFGNADLNGTNSTTVTVRSGIYSMEAGFYDSTNLVGSGAFQAVSASAGQTWRLTGYLFVWENAKVIGPDPYGEAQLVFLDSSSNVLQTVESPRYGTDANLPVNTWVPFEVDATAPAGTVTVLVYVLAVGQNGDLGNFFFDDLNLYQPSSSSTASVSSTAPAMQISWPTSSKTNETDYQVQYNSSLIFSNPTVANVISNGGFETNGLAWILQAGSSYSTGLVPAHTGSNTLKEVTASTGLVPVTYQSEGLTPGSVWDLQGYAYNWSGAPIHQAGTRALLKIVWLDSNGASLQCVPQAQDTNLLGSIETGSYPGITSEIELSGISPQNVWTLLESRGTAPAAAAQIQSFCILVTGASGPTETVFFDDVIAFQPVGFFGWQDLGPLWLANGHTNQVYDVVGTNATKFYRIITP